MFTIRSIVQALLILPCLCILTSCGDDENDDPPYIGGEDVSTSDFTPQDLCGQWVFDKVILDDGSTKVFNTPFTVSNPQLHQLQGNTYSCRFDTSTSDDDVTAALTASVIGGKILAIEFVIGYSDVDHTITTGGITMDLNGGLSNIILDGQYGQLDFGDLTEPHPIKCKTYISKR